MRTPRSIPFSQEELKALLDYNPETGELRWKVRLTKRSSAKAGDLITPIEQRPHGYRLICFKWGRYLVHRVVWKWMTGEDPESGIDHKDRDPANNRWCNLRLATPAQNGWNSDRKGKRNIRRKGNRWHAEIFVNGRSITSRKFDSEEEAISAARDLRLAHYKDFAPDHEESPAAKRRRLWLESSRPE